MRAFRLLKPSEIEVRIAEIDRQGRYVRLLLYKTVRTDAALLDETYGPQNWQNDYKSIDGKLYCGIAIRFGDEWITKWNTGTESNMEAQKGEASDAMKRAGFVWGIGTELYSAPQITVWDGKAEIKKRDSGGYACYDRFSVRSIDYDENEDISRLVIVNEKTGADVFAWGAGVKPLPEPKPEPVHEERCERCGKVLVPYKNSKGQTVTVAQHIAASKKKCNGMQLCLDCAMEYEQLKHAAAVQ
jgi:hypothetical protein